MKRAVLLLAVLSVIFSVSEVYAKKVVNPISAVLIEGIKNVKEKTVRGQIKSKKGVAYAEETVKADMQSILELGFFENVEVSVDTPTWRVTFKIREKPYIKNVNFKGNKVFSLGKLKGEITLKEKEYYDLSKLEESKSKVATLYKEKGYADIKLETIPTIDERTNQMTLTFILTEGNRILIGDVTVEGVKAYKPKKILGLMKTKRKKVYKEETFADDRKEIEKFYKDNGYMQVEINKPEVTYNKERTLMYIRLHIKEGLKYKIGTITFKNNTVFTRKELDKAMYLKPGNIYNEEKMQESLQTVQEMYSDKGYLHAKVRSEFDPDDQKKIMNITFDITENEIVYLGMLYVDGLTSTKEFVIRREVLLKEGDVFSAAKVRRSLEKINNLGFIESVEPELQPTEKHNVMDLVLNVTEGKPGMLTAGAGYSSVDKLVGTLQLSHINLFGRAERLNLQYEFGATKNDYSISWTEPWFMNKPVSLGLSLFNTQTQLAYSTTLDAYQENRKGGSVTVGPRLSDIYSLSFSYAYEDIAIIIIDPSVALSTANPTGISASEAITSSIQSSIIRDTRDNIFDASRGSKQSLTFQYAGGPFGGNTNFIKTVAASSWYIPTFWKFVLSFNITAGGIDKFNTDQDVPIYERFYVGGADTVRGYQYRTEIGPLQGGKAMAVANVEYKFPIVQEKNHTVLQGVLFYDVGGSWLSADDVDLSLGTETNKLKAGIGFGIRFTTPVFPLRLDWGYGLNHNPGQELSQFYFTIGNIF